MARTSRHRKILLGFILLVVLAAHAALFAAGGSWRTMGFALLVVDLFSGWFVVMAVRESRKLEKTDPN